MLYLDLDENSFVKRDLNLTGSSAVVPQGAREFVNLDSVWYAICHDEDTNSDTLQIVDGMNDFTVTENPFGCNPFDEPLLQLQGGKYVPDPSVGGKTFN